MDLNKSNVKKILLLITFAVLLLVGAMHPEIVFDILQSGLALLKPFVVGGVMAFMMNVLLRFVEEKLFAPLNRKNYAWWSRCRRAVCVVLTIGLLIGFIFILLFMIVPEIILTGRMIAAQLPNQLDQFFTWAQNWLASLEIPMDVFQNINIDWNKVVNIVTDSIKNGGSAVFNTTLGITSSIVGGVMNLVLSLVFSIYLLLQKEQLGAQLKNVMLAFLPPQRVEKILSVGRLSNRIFSKFVSGQCTEAVILGLLCFTGMSIFSMPYAMMISVVVGVWRIYRGWDRRVFDLDGRPNASGLVFDLYCSPSAVRGELDISARGWKICGTPRPLGIGGSDHWRQPVGRYGNFTERAGLLGGLFAVSPACAGSAEEKACAGAKGR